MGRRRLVITMVASCAAFLVAGAAWGQVVVTMPQSISVCGIQSTSARSPDPSAAFTITITINGIPLAGSQIALDFQNCTDLRLCTGLVNGQLVDCTTKQVRGVTNALGSATFFVLGGGVNAGTVVPPLVAPGAGAGCMRVYADGVQLGTATVVIYDQDGALPGRNGVNGLNLSVVLTEIGAGSSMAPYRGRSDYHLDGSINGFDLSVFLDILGRSVSGLGSGAGCADGGNPAPYCP